MGIRAQRARVAREAEEREAKAEEAKRNPPKKLKNIGELNEDVSALTDKLKALSGDAPTDPPPEKPSKKK